MIKNKDLLSSFKKRVIGKDKTYLKKLESICEPDRKIIDFYSRVVESLLEKELWDLVDFKIAHWLQGSLREYKKENRNEIDIPILNKLSEVVLTFQNRINKYQSVTNNLFLLKHKKSLISTIMEEKNDDKLLFKLIEHDKQFLFMAKDRIMRAQAFNDNRFFIKLANSLKKGTDSEFKKMKRSTQRLREILILHILNEDVLKYADLNNIKHLKCLRVALTNRYTKELEVIQESVDKSKSINTEIKAKIKQIDGALDILCDENYFIYKWVPRHILGGDTKKFS